MYDVKIMCTGTATLVIPMHYQAEIWCYRHFRDIPTLQPKVWMFAPDKREEVIALLPKDWIIWQ